MERDERPQREEGGFNMKKWIILLLFLISAFVAIVIYAPSKKASLIVQAIGVFVSSIIAISAIWGELIRASLAGPKLLVSLYSPEGELTNISNGPNVRYYHLKVANKRSGVIARNTRVNVISIQREESDGWQKKLEVYGVQLPWVFSDSQVLNIGPEAKCDVISIVDKNDFKLAYYWRPNNVDPFFKARQAVRIEVIAVAENAKSKILSLEISWDGQWSKDDQEMKEHLNICEV